MTRTGSRDSAASSPRVCQLSAGSIRAKVSAIVTARSHAHRRGDAGYTEVGGDREAGAAVALAVAAGRGVDGDDDRLEAGLHRLLHQRPGHRLVAEAVELEPAPAVRRRGRQLARPGRRQGREAHHRPDRGRRPRHPHLALGVDQPLVGDRRHQQRHREWPAEQLDRGRGPRRRRPATRGRSRQRRQASTFSRSVSSSPAPPAK